MDDRRVLIVVLISCLIVPNPVRAEFLLERVEVTISDIRPDGTAKITEDIKMIIKGEHSQSLYDSGYGGYYNNDLSFWSTTTGLKDVKQHVNPAKVDISDFRLRPQPRGKCNPVQMLCHGELILEYIASPSYNSTEHGKFPIAGTGIFTVEKTKPRTTQYTLNPQALSFTTTEQGNIILDEEVYLIIELPNDAVVYDVNPVPEDVDVEFPARIFQLSWNDMALVKFSLVFEIEESIQEEVSDFFLGVAEGIETAVRGEYGLAIFVLVAILIGGYLYINLTKRKKEET